VARRLSLLALAAVALAGCGGSHRAAGTTASCTTPAAGHALARIDRDLTALKAAGAKHVSDTLLGGPAVNHATDRFLLDLAKAPIDNLARNRLIDHAAASVIANCQQCFQALEAERPIPAIAHGEPGTSCPAKP
jgi:hypothetical protein